MLSEAHSACVGIFPLAFSFPTLCRSRLNPFAIFLFHLLACSGILHLTASRYELYHLILLLFINKLQWILLNWGKFKKRIIGKYLTLDYKFNCMPKCCYILVSSLNENMLKWHTILQCVRFFSCLPIFVVVVWLFFFNH